MRIVLSVAQDLLPIALALFFNDTGNNTIPEIISATTRFLTGGWTLDQLGFVLAGGKGSRLYKSLVDQRRVWIQRIHAEFERISLSG